MLLLELVRIDLLHERRGDGEPTRSRCRQGGAGMYAGLPVGRSVE